MFKYPRLVLDYSSVFRNEFKIKEKIALNWFYEKEHKKSVMVAYRRDERREKSAEDNKKTEGGTYERKQALKRT